MTAYNREQAGLGEYASDVPDDDTPDDQPVPPPNQVPPSPQRVVPDSEPVTES